MLKELISNRKDRIFIHVPDPVESAEFLIQAEGEGFIFSDGARPTEKHTSDFYAIHGDKTINYIGTIGRIAYQAHGVKTMEFSQLKQIHTN